MKKIAFIELDTHAEIASNFLELEVNSKRFKVDFYFSEKILGQLNLKESDTIFLSSARTILKQISAQHYDLVIIGTVHRHFNVYLKLAEQYNTSVICHNFNFCSISKFNLLKSIFQKDFIYRLKLFLREGLFSAPKVFSKAKNILYLDEDLAWFLKINRFRSLIFLPLFYTKFSKKPQNSIKKVVIPGSVSQERRDYLMIISKILNFQNPENFQFIFLGKASGKELVWLQNLEKKHDLIISIKYFTEKVPHKEYEEIMNSADILWCRVRRSSKFFGQREIYGKTKMSGNIGDAIKYGKLSIFRKSYYTSKPFIIKEKEDVELQILDVLKNDSVGLHQKYQKDKVLQELEPVLEKLL
ncbi:hypothetical protein SAMN05421847_2104 [Halpernia humi]|uniref:Glycosyl transferase family 1 domain-containing protein n=1 Tax=Halpernia humi TaxID=493375 RepID=A0A1H5ZM85_9FLAO|nr:hypothetical protein [Halpernia humi]SEG37638.1 hypothetical protein SAMN05421847_2104 [Halpernia humi]